MKIDIKPFVDPKNHDLLKEVLVLVNAVIRTIEVRVQPSNEMSLAFHYLENAVLWLTKACNGPLKDDVPPDESQNNAGGTDEQQATG